MSHESPNPPRAEHFRHRRARGPFGVRPGHEGFGLIELIVSLTVFSILIGGVVVSLGAGLALARSNRERSVAANLAAKELDNIRTTTFTALEPGFTTSSVSVDGVSFTVDRTLEWVGASASTGECDSTTTTPQVLRATIEVSWTNMKAVQPIQQTTILAPPVGSYDPYTGHIAVRVRDSTSTPLGSVPVRVTGTNVDETITTTDDDAASAGCAFFGFLPAGTYSVSLGSSGYVDRQGTATPTQSIGVSVGQISSVAFDYDRAATLNVTIAGVNGGTPATAVPVMFGNTGYIPSGTKAFTGSGATRTVSNLFPYTDGYEAWIGDCADADPEGKDSSNVAYWPDAQRASAFEVDPNTTTTGTVVAATVQVDFTRSSGSGTDTIVAEHAADSKCSSGSTLTVATFTASGTTLVALPYGTWTIKASGKTPVGSWPVVSLDPQSTATTVAAVSI